MRGMHFSQKYENQVTEMKRLFLDFMKSMRVRAEEHMFDSGLAADSDNRSDDIQLTPTGFPIIPDKINGDLSKAHCEKLLRDFLGQHYCQFHSNFELLPSLTPYRSCNRNVNPPGSIWPFARRHPGFCGQ